MYYAATNLLKGYWNFIRELQTNTGLGCREDGTVDATDEWWNDATKVLAKLLVSCLATSFVDHLLTIVITWCAGPPRMEEIQVGVARVHGSDEPNVPWCSCRWINLICC
jgi:hypothetical protein